MQSLSLMLIYKVQKIWSRILVWMSVILIYSTLITPKLMANNLQVNFTYCNECGFFDPLASAITVSISQDSHWELNTTGNAPENADAAYFFVMMNDGSGWNNITSSLLPTLPGAYYIENLEKGIIIRQYGTTSMQEPVGYNIILEFQDPPPNDIDIRVFAYEIVQIKPQNDPYLGDGNDGNESAKAFHSSDNFRVKGNESISVDVNTFDDAILESGITLTPSHTAEEFWVMKYEITQGAYRDFLNTLTYPQQVTRTANLPTSAIGTGALTTSGNHGNYMEVAIPSDGTVPAVYGCDASGNNIYDEANDGDNLACNYLSWMDIAAWLDWAGMGPMTEIQYEYICRGNWLPSTGEYAWGYDGTLNTFPLSLTNLFTALEEVTNASTSAGNANYLSSGINRPLRNGIFATSTTNRTQSGGAYWGVMEMSGNVAEACITVGNTDGRSFPYNSPNSRVGDGILSANGNAMVDHWPGNGNALNAEVTGNSGTIVRGGAFNTQESALRVSDRSQGAVPTTRTAGQGGRGVLY